MGRIFDCWLVFTQHGMQRDSPSLLHSTCYLPIHLMEAPILAPQTKLKEYLTADMTWKGGKAVVE